MAALNIKYIESKVYWISVKDKLPVLDQEVLVVDKNGYLDTGMLSKRFINRRINEDTIIEWGKEIDEDWDKLNNIVYWAEFPNPPVIEGKYKCNHDWRYRGEYLDGRFQCINCGKKK
jgi:hypothetical protein